MAKTFLVVVVVKYKAVTGIAFLVCRVRLLLLKVMMQCSSVMYDVGRTLQLFSSVDSVDYFMCYSICCIQT